MVALGAGLGACRDELAPPSRPATDGGADGGRDAATPLRDGAVHEGPRDTGPEPSPCPAPVPVTPADVPAGYLPAATVPVIRVVDGDTAHFRFGKADETIRFLFVNTEESHGSETTAFGTATEQRVRDEIEAASTVAVAVREDAPGTGLPDLDPYDRWLSLVFVDGELYETHLVRAGLSAYYTKFGCAPEPIHANLVAAEAEARAARRGIWAAGHPTNYAVVLADWIGNNHCRPNPYREPYCP